MRNKLLIALIVLLLIFPVYAAYRGVLVAATAPQTITNAWVDVGGEIKTETYKYLTIWVNIDIGTSTNIRLRALSKHTSAGTDEYFDALYTPGSSDIKAESEYIEFNVDEDKKYKLVYDLKNSTNYIQLQVQSSNAGDGQIDSCYYSLAWD